VSARFRTITYTRLNNTFAEHKVNQNNDLGFSHTQTRTHSEGLYSCRNQQPTMEVLMAKKETPVAPKVQSRVQWIDAYEQGTKTKAQAIARCKHMVAKKGDTTHGKLWAKWLAELEGKPKAKAKAKPKASVGSQGIAKLSKAQLVDIVQRFIAEAE